MELILKENVIGLGYKDEIVTVKDGYGRNYLIPTGKAHCIFRVQRHYQPPSNKYQ